MQNIETGVDKLVNLLRERKKVSVEDASKALQVPEETILEWADFLEENHVLKIDYGLTHVYLVETKISGKELEKKQQEFSNQKNQFLKKTEITLLRLEDEKDTLNKLKNEFETFKEKLSGELKDVEKNYNKLKNYEELDKKFEDELFERMHGYATRIKDIEKDMKKEETMYKDIVKEFDEETKEVLKDEKLIRHSEGKVKRKIKKIGGKAPKEDQLAHDQYIQELIHFLKSHMNKGLKKEDIRKELKKVGWTKEQIDKLLKS